MTAASTPRSRRCIELWDRHAGRLVLYASALLPERQDAEDVVQAVFARIWERGTIPDPGFETAYLFQAVRNEASNARRTRRRAEQRRLLEPASQNPDDLAAQVEWGQRVEEALRSLPAEEHEAIVLRIWGALSGPEAARIAGVSEKALEHRYYRGLASLKDVLGAVHE